MKHIVSNSSFDLNSSKVQPQFSAYILLCTVMLLWPLAESHTPCVQYRVEWFTSKSQSTLLCSGSTEGWSWWAALGWWSWPTTPSTSPTWRPPTAGTTTARWRTGREQTGMEECLSLTVSYSCLYKCPRVSFLYFSHSLSVPFLLFLSFSFFLCASLSEILLIPISDCCLSIYHDTKTKERALPLHG